MPAVTGSDPVLQIVAAANDRAEKIRIQTLTDEQLLEEVRCTHFETRSYDLLIDEVERRELDI